MSLFANHWSFGRQELNWPTDANGEQEQAVLLVSTQDTPAEVDVLISLLQSCEIPCVRRYTHEGGAGRVVIGFSGYGVDLLVPQSRVEEAKALLNAQPLEEDVT